jgi:phosphoglycerate dehydrogenase-like enzyme
MIRRGEQGMFRVGVTRDFLKADGTNGFGDVGLEMFDEAGIAWEYLPQFSTEIEPEAAQQYDGLFVLGPRVTARTLGESPRLKIVARMGVGYDTIDVPACTAQGVLLTITPDGVRRPVAAAALTLVLALTHRLWIKDRLTRTGRWSDRLDYTGIGTTGATLGIIGYGNIGADLARLATPLDMRILAADPFASEQQCREQGVTLVEVDELVAESDYVVVCCALNESTYHLIDARRIGMMKRRSFLVNVARGPIVDQAALYEALREGRILGAGLDVFEKEPIDPQDPLLQLENVIVAPHSLAWTDECFRGMGRGAVTSLVQVARGETPRYIVNRDAMKHPRWTKS